LLAIGVACLLAAGAVLAYLASDPFGDDSDNVTRWISEHLRQDSPDSPDGRLGYEGIEFAQGLLGGRLQLSGASDWLRTDLCRRPAPIYRTSEVGSSDSGA
jgi:hypothetical protein